MVGGISLPVPMTQVLDDVDAALVIDPDFVSALNLRANLYMNRVNNTVRWDVALREARESVDHALTLAPNNIESLNQLATIQMYLELDPGGAQQTLERVRVDKRTHRTPRAARDDPGAAARGDAVLATTPRCWPI